MQPISKFIFCSLNITVKMLIMTKVGQKIVGYIRKAYFDANFSFATYTLQVSLLFAYINSQLYDTMESNIVVGDSQCKYLWRYSNAPLIPPCRIRSDRQTTSLTLTTGVCKAGTKIRGASNMNIHYDVIGLLTAAWRSDSGQIVWAA